MKSVNTQEYHTYFYTPDEVDISWNSFGYIDSDPSKIVSYLDRVKFQIRSPKDIVVLWAGANRLCLHVDTVRAIDNFAQEILNPVVLLNGNQSQPITNTNFIYAAFPYFEYVAGTIWKLRTNILNVRNRSCFMVGTKDYPSRKYLLSKLVETGLDKVSYISYKQAVIAPLSPYCYTDQQILEIRKVADRIDNLLPWPTLDNSVEFNEMPRHFMLDSCVNIVTDTFFEGDIFVSEKVFTAIAHGQMFVMLAPAGTLAYLRSRGYQTFGTHIDESYDTITDNYERLLAVVKVIETLAKQDINQLYQQCQHIVEYNYRHFYNSDINAEFVALLQH